MSVRIAARSPVAELTSIVEGRRVHSVFQAVVDLDTLAPVAYEALARGPAGSSLERPDDLFAAARGAGRVADLDWICREAAVRGAQEVGLAPPLALFLNVEPAALHRPVPPAFKRAWSEAGSRLRVVLEIAERALTDQPAELLWSVAWARESGWGIALDDVGGDSRSLALLPFLRPDVVKLDLGRMRGRAAREVAETVHAVAAESERTGAVLVAEGVETTTQLDAARAFGATLAQGWLLGRPGALPPETTSSGPALAARVPAGGELPVAFTPFDLLSARRPIRRATKRVLLALSRSLEQQATAAGGRPVVLSAFGDESHFTPRTRDQYARLAREGSFVAALGAGMGPAPAPGVRGARLSARDPLRGEWVVSVVDSHFFAAFAARDLGDEGDDLERRFDFAITYERGLVVQVALSLMAKVVQH